MKHNLSDIKIDYNGEPLTDHDIKKNPFQLFTEWFEAISQTYNTQPNAMTLSTIGVNGFPQSRIVLLKHYSEDGFQFYTSYISHKGKAIAKNKNVSLTFYWPELERQLRIEGIAKKTSAEDSDDYFNSRPLESRISAAVSVQSKLVKSRKVLEQRIVDFKAELNGREPERPKEWGGYIVKPVRFEFWQGRPNRLHDRLVYELINKKWIISRLEP